MYYFFLLVNTFCTVQIISSLNGEHGATVDALRPRILFFRFFRYSFTFSLSLSLALFVCLTHYIYYTICLFVNVLLPALLLVLSLY